MAALSDPYREHLVAIEPLGPDELRVLTYLAKRLATGQGQYGRLDLVNDLRNFRVELLQELADGAVYAACDAVRTHLLATAPTDPCPPPAPSTLGERMAAAGWAMREAIEVDDVPDDRRTERGT